MLSFCRILLWLSVYARLIFASVHQSLYASTALSVRATTTAAPSLTVPCTGCILAASSPETLTYPSSIEVMNHTITTASVTRHIVSFANGDPPITHCETNEATSITHLLSNTNVCGQLAPVYVSELVWTTYGKSLTWPTTYLHWFPAFGVEDCTSSIASIFKTTPRGPSSTR